MIFTLLEDISLDKKVGELSDDELIKSLYDSHASTPTGSYDWEGGNFDVETGYYGNYGSYEITTDFEIDSVDHPDPEDKNYRVLQLTIYGDCQGAGDSKEVEIEVPSELTLAELKKIINDEIEDAIDEFDDMDPDYDAPEYEPDYDD